MSGACLFYLKLFHLLLNKLHSSIAVMTIMPTPVIHAAKMIGAKSRNSNILFPLQLPAQFVALLPCAVQLLLQMPHSVQRADKPPLNVFDVRSGL